MANTALTGTFSVDDLLAVRNASAAEFGLDNINKALQADLSFYNGLVSEQMGLFAENLTVQSKIYGASVLHQMEQVDEFGVAPSKKGYSTGDVSFPLRMYSSSIGWTQKFLEIATPEELASEYLSVRAGHSYEINKQIKKAIYNNTNYTFVDKLSNGVSLTVRRFLNADSQAIPDFQGTSFTASSHTHYVASATLTGVAINSLISNVQEHGHTRGLKLIINIADKPDMVALTGTGSFVPLSNAIMVYNASDSTLTKLDNTDLANQMIGYWDGNVEVWVKPYAVENYMLCITSEGEKALGFRQRPQASLQGLRLVSDLPGFPLISKSFEAEFGLAVNSRTSGAVLYFANATWANPTIS